MGRLVGWLGLALAWLGWIHFVSQVNSLQVLNDSLFCRSLHSSEHSNYREGWQVKPNGSKSQKFSGQLECKLLHKMCQTLPTQNTCQTASEQTQKLQSKSVTAKRKQDREKPKKRQRNYQKKKNTKKAMKNSEESCPGGRQDSMGRELGWVPLHLPVRALPLVLAQVTKPGARPNGSCPATECLPSTIELWENETITVLYSEA